MRPLKKALSALDCFLPDELPFGSFPVYDIDPNIPSVVWENNACLVTISPRSRCLIPMENPIPDLEYATMTMIDHVASSKPAINVLDVLEYMGSNDLELSGILEQNGKFIAVTLPEYLGRMPTQDSRVGLLIHNAKAIVQVVGTRNEMDGVLAISHVMNS